MGNPETPEISREDGFAIVDAIVANTHGIHARPSSILSKEASRYDGRKIFLSLPEKSRDEYDCKALMEILQMEAHYGDHVRIYVEGEDKESEKIALRFYHAICAKNHEEIRFDLVG